MGDRDQWCVTQYHKVSQPSPLMLRVVWDIRAYGRDTTAMYWLYIPSLAPSVKWLEGLIAGCAWKQSAANEVSKVLAPVLRNCRWIGTASEQGGWVGWDTRRTSLNLYTNCDHTLSLFLRTLAGSDHTSRRLTIEKLPTMKAKSGEVELKKGYRGGQKDWEKPPGRLRHGCCPGPIPPPLGGGISQACHREQQPDHPSSWCSSQACWQNLPSQVGVNHQVVIIWQRHSSNSEGQHQGRGCCQAGDWRWCHHCNDNR